MKGKIKVKITNQGFTSPQLETNINRIENEKALRW